MWRDRYERKGPNPGFGEMAMSMLNRTMNAADFFHNRNG